MSASRDSQKPDRRELSTSEAAGLGFGIGAFGVWSLTPFYFKELSNLGPVEIVAHRIVWCAAILLLILSISRQWPAVRAAFATPRVLWTLAASAAVNGLNWAVFIYSVISDQLVAGALGYYLNPLFSVLIGFVILRERLSRLQWLAVAFAAAGVANRFIALGEVPWIALTIAICFATYGYIRKTVAAGSATGLFVECVLLSPLCLGWLIWLGLQGTGAFGVSGPAWDLFIAASGIITAVPLLMFAAGARRIKLATIGLLQYLTPSFYLVMAVFLYGEHFGVSELITFGLIWLALALYTAEIWRTRIV